MKTPELGGPKLLDIMALWVLRTWVVRSWEWSWRHAWAGDQWAGARGMGTPAQLICDCSSRCLGAQRGLLQETQAVLLQSKAVSMLPTVALDERDSPYLSIPFIDCSLWKNGSIPTSQCRPLNTFCGEDCPGREAYSPKISGPQLPHQHGKPCWGLCK